MRGGGGVRGNREKESGVEISSLYHSFGETTAHHKSISDIYSNHTPQHNIVCTQ